MSLEKELTKKCSKCGSELNISYFCGDKSTADLYHPHCFFCRKKYREQNKEKIRERFLLWEKKNIDRHRAKQKQYYYKNHESIIAYGKKWRQENRERIIKEAILRKKELLKTNINYKLSERMRCRVRNAIKQHGGRKNTHLEELIGCSIIELRKHIEKQFKEGMSWDNHGAWHIDHIIPCSHFNLQDINEQKKCFNYNNVQPLWATENLTKNNKGILSA